MKQALGNNILITVVLYEIMLFSSVMQQVTSLSTKHQSTPCNLHVTWRHQYKSRLQSYWWTHCVMQSKWRAAPTQLIHLTCSHSIRFFHK